MWNTVADELTSAQDNVAWHEVAVRLMDELERIESSSRIEGLRLVLKGPEDRRVVGWSPRLAAQNGRRRAVEMVIAGAGSELIMDVALYCVGIARRSATTVEGLSEDLMKRARVACGGQWMTAFSWHSKAEWRGDVPDGPAVVVARQLEGLAGKEAAEELAVLLGPGMYPDIRRRALGVARGIGGREVAEVVLAELRGAATRETVEEALAVLLSIDRELAVTFMLEGPDVARVLRSSALRAYLKNSAMTAPHDAALLAWVDAHGIQDPSWCRAALVFARRTGDLAAAHLSRKILVEWSRTGRNNSIVEMAAGTLAQADSLENRECLLGVVVDRAVPVTVRMAVAHRLDLLELDDVSRTVLDSERRYAYRGGVRATISVSWGYERHSITLTSRNWSKVRRGRPLKIRGAGYHYEGEFFWDYWCFAGGFHGGLVVSYSGGGCGFDGRLCDAQVEEHFPVGR